MNGRDDPAAVVAGRHPSAGSRGPRYRDDPVLMKCGHPRAAREIVVQDGRLRTECWVCRIEGENR